MFIVYCNIHSLLMSASTDKTGAIWDVEAGKRVKKLKGHSSFVNSCCASRRGPQLAVTGSDDGTVKVRQVFCLMFFKCFNGHHGVFPLSLLLSCWYRFHGVV